MNHKVIDFDYTKYLGEGYKEKQNTPKYISTYVVNHSSWLDVMIMLSKYKVAFAAKEAFEKVPVFGLIVSALGSIFVARGASL